MKGFEGRVGEWRGIKPGLDRVDSLHHRVERKTRYVLFPAAVRYGQALPFGQQARPPPLAEPLDLGQRQGMERTDGQSP